MATPTLRSHYVAPATNVTASVESGKVKVGWQASPDPAVSGYHVYRAASPDGPFTRLTAQPLPDGATTFNQTGTPPDRFVYMVRAVKLQTTASGSYFNPSQGAFNAPTVSRGEFLYKTAPQRVLLHFSEDVGTLAAGDLEVVNRTPDPDETLTPSGDYTVTYNSRPPRPPRSRSTRPARTTAWSGSWRTGCTRSPGRARSPAASPCSSSAATSTGDGVVDARDLRLVYKSSEAPPSRIDFGSGDLDFDGDVDDDDVDLMEQILAST